MEENVYKEACRVYNSSNGEASNDYEEACTVSPPKVSPPRIGKAPGPNPAPSMSGVSGEPGSSESNDKRQAADPGPASAETAGFGMSSPGQSRVWTSAMLKTYAVVTMVLICCLLGVTIFLAVTVSDLKLTVRKLDQKTTDDLSGLKLAFNKVNKKADGILANVSEWMQQAMEKDVSERLVGSEKALTHLSGTCPGSYKKYHEVCYKAFYIRKSFSESAETCRADGGTLAMPRDAGTDDFLVSLVKPAFDFSYWIGLHQQEDSWEWIDGTALGTGYNRWGDNEPNDVRREDRVAMVGCVAGA
ncbi:PREDICTED: C-type lectin domain family 4 member M-like [Branchiostoma belcheri]|uniref:C-type lectin domain family 4 member M-like n=1 Tax=Branchiostoma belcheri TaxID=7741 RepID=A0A6P5AJ56_BRABE|nr:PREDICTED: C-type lectin domain family 4 member M-like [Branchiostoma belcheri]